MVNRQSVDYLPSQITFANRTRNEEIAEKLGLTGEAALEDYLENHLELVFAKYDLPLFLRNDLDLMRQLQSEGIVGLDEKNSIVYDIWGMGIKIGEEGFYYCYSPFKGDKEANRCAEPFLPDHFDKKLLSMEPLRAVEAFEPPDPMQYGNVERVVCEAKRYEQQGIYAAPSGYFGIWERTNGMLGFEENMTYMAEDPRITEAMFEKVTDYKIKLAYEYLKLDLPIYHHGDDLGFQTSTFFSPDMFKRLLLPHLKKLFAIYKSEGRKVAYHSCGNITKNIPLLIEAGIDILEPVQPCMDIASLKREFGRDLIFWGGIDTQYVLPYGSEQEVREHTRRTIRTLGEGGGHIIGPSQEIMGDVPIRNIVAMLEEIKQERVN